MNTIEVLILHGSPGSGKSTLAEAITEQLRESNKANALIDLDELSIVYPPQGSSFSRRCLKAIWPNYAAIPNLKAIIPTVIADAEDQRLLFDAMPDAKIKICELTAPKPVLKERVSAREPNEYWQNRLQKWVDVYHQRDESQKFGDFQIQTHGKSINDAAREIIETAGW